MLVILNALTQRVRLAGRACPYKVKLSEINRHGIGPDERKRIVRLRLDVDANHIKASAM